MPSSRSHHHHHHDQHSPSHTSSSSAGASSVSGTAASTESIAVVAESDSHQLTLLGRSLGPETIQHFATNPYFCGSRATAVKILRDILAVVHEFKMLHRVTTWGETAQKRLCIFGILPVTFGGAQTSNLQKEKRTGADLSLFPSSEMHGNTNTTTTSSSSSTAPGSSGSVFSFLQPPAKLDLGFPVQVWLSHNYPVDPPQLYVVPSSDFGEQLVANHPIVDRSGTIYAPQLASWNPAESTLVPLLRQVQRIFGVIPPLWIDDRRPASAIFAANANAQSSPASGISVGSATATTSPSSSFASAGSPSSSAGVALLQHYDNGLSSLPDAGHFSNTNNNSINNSFSAATSSNFFVDVAGVEEKKEDESALCVVCLSEEKDTVLVPCGHYALCSSCATSVQSCPICRGQIRLRQRVFL